MRFRFSDALPAVGAGTRRVRPHRRIAVLGSVLTLGLGLVVATSTPASAATGCSASYATESEWSTGFVGAVTVTNTGTDALTAWTVTFTFGGDQKVTSSWNASLTQSIEYITASSLDYNGSVGANASTSFGFQGTYSTSDAAPATLSCSPESTVTPAIVTNTTATPVMQGFTSTVNVALSAAPTADVTVSASRASGNSGLSVGSGASLTFTSTNWNTPQSVTIAADSTSVGAADFTIAATGHTSATVTATEVASTDRAAAARVRQQTGRRQRHRGRPARDEPQRRASTPACRAGDSSTGRWTRRRSWR